MSEENTNNQTQPLDADKQTMRKASPVPLRKETVRVALRATPASSAPRAPMPTAMTPSTAPHVEKVSSPVNPDIPNVTSEVPLKHETLRVTLKAKPELNMPSSGAPAPVPTVVLNEIKPVTMGPKLTTQSAPQVTVPLSQAQSFGTPAASASPPIIQTVIDDESVAEAAANREMILACVVFLLSLFVLFAQYQRASIWIDAHEDGDVSAIFTSLD